MAQKMRDGIGRRARAHLSERIHCPKGNTAIIRVQERVEIGFGTPTKSQDIMLKVYALLAVDLFKEQL